MGKKIKIDVDHLVNIRKTFDELLGDEIKEHIKKEKTSYKEYSFTRNEKLIYEYVEKHPGIIKKGVIDAFGSGIEFEGHKVTLSPVTVLKTIEKLENEKIIDVREDENNSQIHHLFINNGNVLVSLIRDLEYFKKSYFNLINEIKAIIKSLNDKTSVSNRLREWDLIDALLMPYKFLINTWIMSDLILRHKESIEKNILTQRFAVISTTIQEIQIKVHKSISTLSRFYDEDEIYGKMFENGLQALTPDNAYSMLQIFEKHDLSKNAEDVLDIVWKMSIPLLRDIINTNYSVFIPAEVGSITDWRKLICPPIYQYTPKTGQNSYLKSYE